MFSKIIAVLFVFAGCSLMAAAPRIDILSSNVKLKPASKIKGGYCSNPAWMKKKKEFYVSSQGPQLKEGEWVDYEVSFIPETDGVVVIRLMGNCHRDKNHKMIPEWVCWDDVVIEGAEVVNGDFEKGADKPSGWRIGKGQYLSKDGNKYIKAWHNRRAEQTIKVKAGQKVMIKARAKKADAEDKKIVSNK